MPSSLDRTAAQVKCMYITKNTVVLPINKIVIHEISTLELITTINKLKENNILNSKLNNFLEYIPLTANYTFTHNFKHGILNIITTKYHSKYPLKYHIIINDLTAECKVGLSRDQYNELNQLVAMCTSSVTLN